MAGNNGPLDLEDRKATGHRRLLWGGVIVLVIAAAWYGWYAGQGMPSVHYVTEPIERGRLEVTVTADGTLKPLRTVSIGSELSGIVREVMVDVNDRVRAGQTLIRLDPSNLEATVASARAGLLSAKAGLAQAKAQLNEAAVKYRRQQDLHERSGGRMPATTELESQKAAVQTAKAGVEVAQASIDDAQARLSTAEVDLQKADIKSSIDGIVLARSVEPGYAVAASLQAVELLSLATDLSTLELQISVDEADVGVVRPGQPAYFTVSAYPDRRFEAELKKVAFGATTTENVVTYTAYLNVPNKNLLLRPGMTASATISTAVAESALLVPNSAFRFKPRTAPGDMSLLRMGPPHESGVKKAGEEVSHGRRTRTLYVLRDGKPLLVSVQTGLTDGVNTEIVSGDLREGDSVIVDQQKAKTS